MRLIGIGLLAFLLAGLALVLARSEMVGQTLRAVRTLSDGPQLRFETPMAAEAMSGENQAIILRESAAAPLILSGLPAYQSAVFHLPTDARPTSGFLQIDATAQVLDGVEGVLRISIDNTRRAEVLLRPGEAVRSVRIELTPADIARAQLVVSFSLQGTLAGGVCTADHAVPAVVEIETTSALYLSLDAPLGSPRDRIAAWGDQLRLVWTGDEQSLLQAVTARRAGVQVMIVPEMGLSAEEIDVALANRSTTPDAPHFAWSEAMAQDSGLFGLRRFQRSHTWRLRSDFAAAEHPNLPQTLALSMALPRHPMGADWQITVARDDRLLAHFTGSATQFDERIALPATPGGVHLIEITLTSTFQPEGLCNDGPEILAEILSDTHIIPSDEAVNDPVRALTAALASESALTLGLGGPLTAVEASVAAAMLATVLPHHGYVASVDGAANITVLPRGAELPEVHADTWLVSEGPDGMLGVIPASDHPAPWTTAITLLVHLPDTGS